MLHLDILKGKDAMKTSIFQKKIGGTALCTKILMVATKWCGQLKPNDIYFSDSWFSGVKTYDEAVALGVDYCGPVKTMHESFCLSIL